MNLVRGIVIKVLAKPAFYFFDTHLFSLTVIFDLVKVDFAEAEIAGLGVREVEAADA